MNISKLKKNSKVFSRLFGIKPDKFDDLVSIIEPRWLKAEFNRRTSRPRKIKVGGGRPYRLTLEESIALLLLYTRTYANHAFLAALFDINDSMVCRYFAKIRPITESVFTLSERSADLREEEIMRLVVDATEQRTERRKDGPTGYSGKKKAHTVKTQIVVDKKGNIMHISPSAPGNMHDKKLFDRSGVMLPDNAKGDLGYLGTNLAIPFKSSKWHSLTKRQRNYNQRHSHLRIVVEHVFASLKSFRILADRFRGSLCHYHEYFMIVCGLRSLARS